MRPLDPRVRPHLRPARATLVVVLGGNMVNAGLVIAQAFAVAALVARLVESGDWATPAWWLAAVTLARAAVGWVVDVAAARAAERVGTHLRTTAIDAALALPAGQLQGRRTGELTTLVTRGAGAVEPYLTRYLPALVLAGVLPVLTTIAIASLDWWAALVIVATLPLVPVFAILIGMTTRERAERQWRRLGDLAGHFLDVVRGLPTLVAHGRGEAQVPVIRSVTHRYRRATGETLKLAFLSSAALELIATISVALVAVLVGLRLAAGGLDLETALTVLLLAPEAYWPLRKVGAEYHAAAEGTATFVAIHDLMNASPTATPIDVELPTGADLVLDDVALAWPDRAPVVAGLDVRFPARGLSVITGPSGSGKSTLVQALLGELPLSAGTIRLGDVDLSRASAQWQRQVAQVPQRPWLSATSIADNLTVGRPDADRADLWAALRAVRLDGVVARLPEALDTVLGDDGAGLSAGQRARLALARVLVSGRPWIILDEPTAHLDAESERILLDTLREQARERAVVVVAHRAALVEAADHVVTLAAGPAAPVPVRPAQRERPRTGTLPAAATVASDSSPGTAARWRWPLGVLLAIMASASGVALTATAGWLIARADERPPVMMLTLAIVGVRTFGLARPVLRYAERLVSHDVALGWLADRRADLYAALVPLVPARTGRRGDSLAGLVDDVDSLLDDRLRVRMPVWTWLGVTVLTGVVAWFLAPMIALVVVGVAGAGVAAFATARFGARRAEPELVRWRGVLGREVHDALTAARQLVLWQATPAVSAHLAQVAARQGRAGVRSALGVATARAIVTLACGAGVALAAAAGAGALARGELSAPMVALLVLLPLALGDVLGPVADAGALQVRTRAAAARLDALTATVPAVSDPAVPQAWRISSSPDLQLRGVGAGWGPAPASDTALSDIDLDLRPGARVGITGPSGCGKSTLAAVLLRFLEVRAGSATADGVPVDGLPLAAVRERVGLIDDDPYVFASTVAENVRLARPGASDAAVEESVRRAHLGGWLDGLPDGLATRIGEGGAAVSGGERARLGLARALLADKPVLVLDEPTAHLDTATAHAVADDVLAAAGATGRTLVWITHDAVGLDAMDQVLDLGEVDRSAVTH